jgi:hypothetical protein
VAEALDDPILGHLKWYEDDDQWVAEVNFAPDHPIEVIVEFHEGEDDQRVVLAQAREWLARVGRREPEYRAWSAKQLLDGRWNKDEPMTLADIVGLLCLLSIVCAPDGTAELFWDDDDRLFYGHSIGTRLGADGECVEVEML